MENEQDKPIYCSIKAGDQILINNEPHVVMTVPKVALNLRNATFPDRKAKVQLPTKPIVSHSHFHPQIEDLFTCRVKSLSSITGIATLITPSPDKTAPVNTKRTKITCTEKLKEIRESLNNYPDSTYCTVVKILGNEFIVEVRQDCNQNGDPSLKPTTIQDLDDKTIFKIFSFLPCQEKLSLRGTCKRWRDLLPLKDLVFHYSFMKVKEQLRISFKNGEAALMGMKSTRRLSSVSSDGNSELFCSRYPSWPLDILPILLEECEHATIRRIELTFFYTPQGTHVRPIYDFIMRHGRDLKELQIIHDDEDDERQSTRFDLELWRGCSQLKELFLRVQTLPALEHIPKSLIHLHLEGLQDPLGKKEISWISRNLTNLQNLYLEVGHNHSEVMNWGSLDHIDTVCTTSTLVQNLPRLKSLTLVMKTATDNNGVMRHQKTDHDEDNDDSQEICDTLEYLKDFIRSEYPGTDVTVENHSSGGGGHYEVLKLNVHRNPFSFPSWKWMESIGFGGLLN